MDKIITPNTVKKTIRFKIKVSWKNGASETILSRTPPNVNPVTPMFMDFNIKDGFNRHISLMEVRALDVEAYEDKSVNLIL